jgi:hypothetical protein
VGAERGILLAGLRWFPWEMWRGTDGFFGRHKQCLERAGLSDLWQNRSDELMATKLKIYKTSENKYYED